MPIVDILTATFALGESAFHSALDCAQMDCILGHTIWTRGLGGESTVVDLGANRGSFYVEMHRRYGCRCFAVEPDPILFNSLPQVPGLTALRAAVYEKDVTVRLFLSANPEANSIDRSIAQRYHDTGATDVRGVTLDSLISEFAIRSVDVLKVDVEGAELGMLKEAGDATLCRFRQIVIEFHDFLQPDSRQWIEDVLARFRKLGFIVLVLSSLDHRDVLLLNRGALAMTATERYRILALRAAIWLRRARAALSVRIRRR